jgi:hypothetical protein
LFGRTPEGEEVSLHVDQCEGLRARITISRILAPERTVTASSTICPPDNWTDTSARLLRYNGGRYANRISNAVRLGGVEYKLPTMGRTTCTAGSGFDKVVWKPVEITAAEDRAWTVTYLSKRRRAIPATSAAPSQR